MTKCSLLGAALIFGLLVSNAASAQARDDTGITGWRPVWNLSDGIDRTIEAGACE